MNLSSATISKVLAGDAGYWQNTLRNEIRIACTGRLAFGGDRTTDHIIPGGWHFLNHPADGYPDPTDLPQSLFPPRE